ncbi:deoxyuridine 5'-triphosphate nucleotidohydrolase [Ruminococcus sp. CAG:403]|nr:deoxyuridine 5'-triphosphate nucleotidohydrolase [Ruminococcus sp. CAG:403]
MKLKIKRVRPYAQVPKQATTGSAGSDLYAALEEPLSIPAGAIRSIPTGIAAEPDTDSVALLIFPRSGLASKHGITLANAIGLVDSDYRGEICVPLINLGKEAFTIEPGMRIAQLVVSPILLPEIEVTDTLTETQRGAGGFGSTGLT